VAAVVPSATRGSGIGKLPWAGRKETAFALTISNQESHKRYNRTVHYDGFSHSLFESIQAVQNFATGWLWMYNNERLHMALGGITPIQILARAA